jgi:enoyl-CoA hydratase/carnithine racemase
MTELDTIRLERPEPGVAVLRLHRPGQLNALTAATRVRSGASGW